MRFGRVFVILYSVALVLLVLCAIIIGVYDEGREEIRFLIRTKDNMEEIKSWEAENGIHYVFLPSYSEMGEVYVQLKDGEALFIGNIPVKNGTSCEDFSLDEIYDVSGSNSAMNKEKIIFLKSSRIPAVYIDVMSGNMKYIHKRKGNEEPGSIRVYTETGVMDYWGDVETLKGRGNSTWWDHSKKPYSLTLRSEGNLLGMGAAQRWILIANAKDSSHLTNKISYDLAQELGMSFSPDCEWVDLYLNGEYAGLYLLSERNEAHENRVEVSQVDGFLVSSEAALVLYGKDCQTIMTNGSALRVHYASADILDVKQMWQSVENAILSVDGLDPMTGKSWDELIDLDSWAMRFLLDETMANYDGGNISQFYYGNLTEGKVYAGPVWDMDACLFNWSGLPNQIVARKQRNWFSPYFELYKKPIFYNKVLEYYQDKFLPKYEELLDEKFMQYAQHIAQAAEMNQIRWGTADYQRSVQNNYDFLEQRITFLNDYWFGDGEYYDVHVETGLHSWKFAILAGESIPEIFDEYTDEWYIYDTGQRYELTSPVYDNLNIWNKEAYTFFDLTEDMSMDEQIVLLTQGSEGTRVSIMKLIPVVILVVILVFCFIVNIIRMRRITTKQKEIV